MQSDKWIIDKIKYYHKYGWDKSSIDEKFKDVPYQDIAEILNGYGGDALGSKTEPYFEKESDYEYVPPTYADLSKDEQEIYNSI